MWTLLDERSVQLHPSPLCHRASTTSAPYKDKIWLWPNEPLLSCLLTRKGNVFSDLCVKLDTSTELYWLAGQVGKDVQQVGLIQDREGNVLTSEECAKNKRWKEYLRSEEEKEREDGRKLVHQEVQKNSEEEEERRLVLMTYHFYNIHVDLCKFLTLLVSMHECILPIYLFESRTFTTLKQRGRASLSSAPLSSFWGKKRTLLTDGSL